MTVLTVSEASPVTATLNISTPVRGLVVPLSEIPDAAFSSGSLGPGLGIEPLGCEIAAPCDGRIIAVAKTGHAVTLQTSNGAELLIHIGLETVALDGQGFDVFVTEGQSVAAGERLVRFDADRVTPAAKSLCTPMILLNAEDFDAEILIADGLVEPGDPLICLSARQGVSPDQARPDVSVSARETVRLDIPDGIHARPAAQIAKRAKTHACALNLVNGNKRANARSVAAMMGLGAQYGVDLVIEGSGEGASQAVADLADLIRSGAGDHIRPSMARGDAHEGVIVRSRREHRDGADIFLGVAASPGIAVGPVHIHTQQDIEVPDHVESQAEERRRLDSALAVVRTDIEAEAHHARGEQAAVLSAHAELADDPGLVEAAVERIETGDNAGQAWRWVIAEQARQLKASGDARMAERVDDLRDLENRLLKVLYGDEAEAPAAQLNGVIVVAEDLLPSQFMRYSNAGLAGLCLTGGGATSHVAILAAAENVPALVALGPDILELKPGAPALVNAAASQLVINPPQAELDAIEEKRRSRREAQSLAALAAGDPARTADDVRIQVMANLASIDDAESALRNGAEGCGLLRTEFLFTNRREAPDQAEQTEVYTAISSCLGNEPLVIRTLDIGGDKPVPFLDLGHEPNPALGLRGIRTLFAHPELMKDQIRAILETSRRRNVHIMVPMVSSPDELVRFRSEVRREALDLGIDTLPPIGTMVETPASAVIADQIASVADFLSIGTNDLTQYTLAMDRGHTALASQMDGLHPAVIGLIARVGEAAGRAEIPASVCGGLASDPLAIPILCGLGITKLSAVQGMVGPVKAIVRELELERCQDVAAEVQTLDSAAEVRRKVLETWPSLERWL